MRYFVERNALEDQMFSFDVNRLGEEIYQWTTSAPIWDGLADEDARTKIRNSFLDFDGSGREGHQSLEDMLPLVTELEAVLEKDNWAGASSSRAFGGTPDFEGRHYIMPALAFSLHLRWICETFGQTPNLVVVYR